MSGFRLLCCLLVLVGCCSVALAAQQAEKSSILVQLQQENAELQRDVNRLESQVAALREEMNTPGASRIIAGLGYIVGIFGVAVWIAARRGVGRGN